MPELQQVSASTGCPCRQRYKRQGRRQRQNKRQKLIHHDARRTSHCMAVRVTVFILGSSPSLTSTEVSGTWSYEVFSAQTSIGKEMNSE